ncbi:MAG: TIGR03915 family putative DNA repair protein [Bacillota bacterium]
MTDGSKSKFIYYIYDGSFEGLLTLIYKAFYRREIPDKIIKKEQLTDNLFSQNVFVKTNKNKADKVYEAIQDKISFNSLKKVYYAFLSEVKDIELDIIKYLKLGFKVGSEINKFLTRPEVQRIQKISGKVGKEKHRLQGLLRFREIKNGQLYAPVEPDYNIIILLSPHFEKRLSNQNWIIHDKKRGIAVLYNSKDSVVIEEKDLEVEYPEREYFYQDLWKEFFKTISIKDRKNKKLQKQYMPVRYWKNLVEK